MFKPNINQFVKSEENILKAKLEGIRATISHPGEKGNSVEYSVTQFIRSFLPSEYGVGTGFIAYHDSCIEGKYPKCKYNNEKDKILLSNQLDIIIYDALRCGPIIRLDSCDVFPIEAVYAYVEVKSIFIKKSDKKDKQNNLQKCIAQTNKLRSIKTRFYYVSVPGTSTQVNLKIIPNFMSIRSYIFALGLDDFLKDLDFVQYLESELAKKEGFISGMYIQDKGFYQSYHGETVDDPKNGTVVSISSERALATFKTTLFTGLSRFPRIPSDWTPAIDTYLNIK